MIYDTVPLEETVILEEPSELDLLLVPPPEKYVPKIPQAGDLLPTIVTPEDAKRYLSEVDTGYDQLNVSIQASSVPVDFKGSWELQMGSWKSFFMGASASVGWLNTKAVMEQTDRFAKQLTDWRNGFIQIGGKPPNPPPITPGQGIPGTTSPADIQKIILGVGVVAAIVIFGPALVSKFS